MKSIEIDRSKSLVEEPDKGHNRWHPDIPPVLEAAPGEEVVLETRDASDCQVSRDGTRIGGRGRIHPLTGPVYVAGAEPGDLLEVEYLEIQPESWGFTSCGPGTGFLPDLLTAPQTFIWDIADGWATSVGIPGVYIPSACFMGTAGVAPSRAQLEQWSRREADLAERGGRVSLPDPVDAVPGSQPVSGEGLRTMPPRENGGNMDVKQQTRGSRLFLPVAVTGALYSAGDAHFAQGDGEVCLTAVEMGATVALRFHLHKGEAERRNVRWPRFSHQDYFAAPEWAAPRNFMATTGMPVKEDGEQADGDLNLATRNALLNMIDLLQERGWTAAQAYAICSVAVDLRISNVVDMPNVTVSAVLPEAIFVPPA